MSTAFNHDEVQLLLESLESHEKNGSMGRAMGSIIGMMICGKDEESRKKFEQEEEKRTALEAIKSRRLSENCTLLRAKLIQYRREIDSHDADKLLADSRQS